MNDRRKISRKRASSDGNLTLEDSAAQNGVSVDRFRARVPELSKDNDRSITLWHGTTRSRARSILRQGFRAEKAVREKGRTFFSVTPKMARRYARTKSRAEGDRPAVIMCSIDLRKYDDFYREGADIYAFRHECISSEVIREVDGLPKKLLAKLQVQEDVIIAHTHVALTFNSSRAGIAYWINSYLKLDNDHRIHENHEAVGKIKQWLDDQVEAGRFGEVPEDEMLEQARKHLGNKCPNTHSYHSHLTQELGSQAFGKGLSENSGQAFSKLDSPHGFHQ